LPAFILHPSKALFRTKLSLYRSGAWQRDRSEALPPPRLAGRIDALLWGVLKVRDHVPSEMMGIRRTTRKPKRCPQHRAVSQTDMRLVARCLKN
jgi:hypothetical protein